LLFLLLLLLEEYKGDIFNVRIGIVVVWEMILPLTSRDGNERGRRFRCGYIKALDRLTTEVKVKSPNMVITIMEGRKDAVAFQWFMEWLFIITTHFL